VNSDPRSMLTPEQAGRMIGRHRKTVIRYINDGRLVASNSGTESNGRRYLIRLRDLDRFVESLTIKVS
jgi:excisionase family DNA binding protein